jgi:hypothetical protein
MFGLFGFSRLEELLEWLSSHREFAVESLNVFEKAGSVFTVSPAGSKLVRCSGNAGLPAFSSVPLVRTGDRCEEVSRRCPFRAVETHVNEVLLGGISLSKVDLTTFIEQDDLVENLDLSADGFTHAREWRTS